MGGTRLHIVKEILSGKNNSIQDEKESIENSAKIQTTYIRRLQNDIKLTTTFLNEANISIEKLISKTEATSPEDLISLKKNIIALCDTYERLPFLSDKSDVIGIASASSIIDGLIQQQTEASLHLNKINENNFQEIMSKQSLMDDYNRLLKLIDQKLITGQGKAKRLDKKSDIIKLDPISTVQHVGVLNNKLEEARLSQDSLLSYLKRVVIKFLAVGDWELQHVMTEEELQENVNVCIELIDKLMISLINSAENDLESVWVEVEPSEIESKLIYHLLMNDILISRDDSTKEKLFLMLRNFDSEF